MTNFERDFSRLFPESQRLERVVTLENQLANELLAGDYTHIPLNSLQERLADSVLFWSVLEQLVIGHTTKASDAEQRLGALMGVVQGLAYDLALDKAPEVVQTDKVYL